MLGPGGIFDQLKKALAERALGAELGHHLAQEAATPATPHYHRNGSTPKTVQTDTSSRLPGPVPAKSGQDHIWVAKLRW